MLRPVIYEATAQRAFVEEILGKCLEIFTRCGAPSPDVAAIVSALILAPFLKHPSFAEEQEWRLVGEARSLKFRAGALGVIPYNELSVNSQCIKELWLGPVSDVQMNKRAWELFLQKRFRNRKGTSRVELKTSAIPLRKID
jgi:hypothetical protein